MMTFTGEPNGVERDPGRVAEPAKSTHLHVQHCKSVVGVPSVCVCVGISV